MNKKRLFFDIEVTPNEGYFWTAGFKQSINYGSIKKERVIICICYKWEGEKKVHSLTWGNGNDKKLLLEFVKIAHDANELVGHNGDKFDLAWVRTRCIFHRIDVSPFLKTIDTLKIARRLFKFNSNRLDYLGQFLGFGGKIHTGYDLWLDTMNKKPGALEKMVKYCKGDVKLLENVFTAMKRYDKSKSHFGRNKSDCPECGSERTVVKCHTVSVSGVKMTDLKCRDCGKMHRVPYKKLINETKGFNGRTIKEVHKGAGSKVKSSPKRIKVKKSKK